MSSCRGMSESHDMSAWSIYLNGSQHLFDGFSMHSERTFNRFPIPCKWNWDRFSLQFEWIYNSILDCFAMHFELVFNAFWLDFQWIWYVVSLGCQWTFNGCCKVSRFIFNGCLLDFGSHLHGCSPALSMHFQCDVLGFSMLFLGFNAGSSLL